MPAFVRLLSLTIDTADAPAADLVARHVATMAGTSEAPIVRARALVEDESAAVEVLPGAPSDSADAIAGRISRAADAHEAQSEEGMGFGDLEDALAAALSLMATEQRAAFLAHWKVRELLAWSEGDDAADEVSVEDAVAKARNAV